MSSFKTIEWKQNKVVMIDQLKLPNEEIYREYSSYTEVADAIKTMVIRGAPAIGIAAAMGVALGSLEADSSDKNKFLKDLDKTCSVLAATRPTAVNLFWAIDRMKKIISDNKEKEIALIRQLLINEAKSILESDIEMCRKIGENGSDLIKDNSVVLTHCNAGGLATGGYGTALGVIRNAYENGKNIKVITSETRPFLQGSRLTAWELKKDGIPVTLVTDNMVGHLMSKGMIDSVVVGADRVASNGDVANKIGTYSVSVLAKHHNIPFYVAAPTSTIDFNCPSGKEIPIEQRDKSEVTHIGKSKIAADVDVLNPAFDITPNSNVDSLITEVALFRSPYDKSLKKIGR
ncbi:MAG: S-methyl-5-thioribose-1-phosphate isomerase [Thermodesulfobacteriota bacterium]